MLWVSPEPLAGSSETKPPATWLVTFRMKLPRVSLSRYPFDTATSCACEPATRAAGSVTGSWRFTSSTAGDKLADSSKSCLRFDGGFRAVDDVWSAVTIKVAGRNRVGYSA